MPDWLLQVIGYAFAGGCVYGAIRADMKAIHEQVKAASGSAVRAHRRIDDHIDRHHVRGASNA